MDPILPAFVAALAPVHFRAPVMQIISNRSGSPAGADIAGADYWVNQLRAPVLFGPGIEWLRAAGIDVFLEAGPGQTLATMTHEFLRDDRDSNGGMRPLVLLLARARA